ncbi:MAG TPA: cupin domain-containing protein [Opitutaceae bacterium]|nr:cupin domain-containing protein [Opitutaceae bacterium]
MLSTSHSKYVDPHREMAVSVVHPGPSIIEIESGTATVYQGKDPNVPHVVNEGESFVEDATLVHRVVNEGDTALEFFVLQIVPFGAPRLILEPAP